MNQACQLRFLALLCHLEEHHESGRELTSFGVGLMQETGLNEVFSTRFWTSVY